MDEHREQREGRAEKCWICWSNEDRNVPAVAMCQELRQPVCQKHADGCAEDGHGALPLAEEPL